MSLQLHALFTDHMVLQQDLPAPVWGWADAGATITVEFAGQTVQACAGDDGVWKATLPATRAGGPFELVVRCAQQTMVVRDVLVGEVWVCSGQSNMEWPTAAVEDADRELAAAQFSQIRLFTVPKSAVMERQSNVEGAWAVCTPETISPFSAVGYFFGRHLHQQLGVPIGLINTSWGGTLAEAWTSREKLLSEPSLSYIVEDFERNLPRLAELTEKYQLELRAWEESHLVNDPGNAGWPQGWADPECDTAAWETMELPQTWQRAGLNYSGVLWFRKTVKIPTAWVGHALTLSIGACDKCDITYFNNVEVGSIGIEDRADAWCLPRVYSIPAELVQAGDNVIAVRVYSHMYAGGMTGPGEIMRLSVEGVPGSETIALDGIWQYQVECNFGLQLAWPPAPPQGPGNPNTPAVLFNGMIAPLTLFAIRGAIWYQGESNASRGYEYRTLFPTMITDWREQWGLGDFPFYFVQLANYMEAQTTPAESPWAELREAQLFTLQLRNTGMAVIIDIGEANDIHPKNKQDVGKRLALNALAQTYGQAISYSSPIYAAAKVEGTAMRVQFDYADGGLVCHGTQLTGFAIAGEDKQFVWAQAIIEGDSVLVSNPAVSAPVAVRYGWAENPACNLYNGAGLPASPFRTDDWPSLVSVTA